MLMPNPNWPTLFAEAAFNVNPYYSTSTALYTDLTPRLYKQWSVRRGKQFELDQVQPAEFRGQWVNRDGYLDPSNTSSPFSPSVIPYRGYRMRTQYPASVNLLNTDQATGGEGTPLAPGSIPAALNIGTDVGATLTIAASGTAFQGSQVFNAAVPASVSVHFYLIDIDHIPVQTPSALSAATYTWSVYLRCTTAAINPSVALAMKFFDINGNFIDEEVSAANTVLTGSATAGWTRLSITRSMSVATGAAYVNLAVAMEGTPPSSPWTLQMDGCQFEQSGSASSFSVPGASYPIFTGAVERYPQMWDYNGTYGLVSPIGVDVMALLSQTIMKDAFVSEVVATSPYWYYQLNEPGGSTTFAEQAGRFGSGTLATAGAGSASPGSSITAATAAGKFLGGSGPVVTFNNTTQFQGQFVDLTPAFSPVGPPVGGSGWTRMLAFRSNSTSVLTMASINDGSNFGSGIGAQPTTNIELILNAGSGVQAVFNSPGGGQVGIVSTTTPVNDNNWHLLFLSVASNNTTATLTVDTTTATTTNSTLVYPGFYLNDAVGGAYYSLSQSGDIRNFIGDLAHYAQWNTVLSPATITTLYNAWRTAGQGESSGARYSRILRYANYLGSQNVDTGSTTSMGPCNDINGLDALTCLQNVVNTETGRHFVDVNGAVTFQSRFRILTVTTPQWTFGENQASGEIPYINLTYDFDPTRISNSVSVTQNLTGAVYAVADTTSEQNYGVRSLTRTSQSLSATEVQQQAYFLLSRYKDPHLRTQTLKIDVAANPALWTSILKFELGQYVAINRRSVSGASMISQLGYIEQITHTGDDKGAWDVELQISPVLNAAPYAVFTALKTTLNANVSSGVNVITINALPDAATNPVRSELTGGQQLLIGSGAAQETVTIATGGVQNQAAGYSTAQLTLTANLVNSHVAGDQVIEVNGVSYDTLGVFDTSLFPY